MSVITTVILSVPILKPEFELEMVAMLNEFDFYGGRGFVHPGESGWYGGGRGLNCFLLIGGFNHLGKADFMEHVANIRWEDLDVETRRVQMLIQEELEVCFTMYRLNGRHMVSNLRMWELDHQNDAWEYGGRF